jgi:hypothetical protein
MQEVSINGFRGVRTRWQEKIIELTHDSTPSNEPPTDIHTVLLSIRTHKQKHGSHNNHHQFEPIHFSPTKHVGCETKCNLSKHRPRKRRAHHRSLNRRRYLGNSLCICVVRPINVTQHWRDHVQGEQAKGIGQKAYTGYDDNPKLERRSVNGIQSPFATFGFLRAVLACLIYC